MTGQVAGNRGWVLENVDKPGEIGIQEPIFYQIVKKIIKKRDWELGFLLHFLTFASRKKSEKN